jgi:putative membrane protein insertion efficiency factor
MSQKICIILMLTGISLRSSAQETNMLDNFSHQFEVETHKHDFEVHADYSNEIRALSAVLFLFYKEFISSQDVNACVFTPSCSVYAIESIKKKGIFIGGMAALDRITRCNVLSYGYYDIDIETNLNIDPVE